MRIVATLKSMDEIEHLGNIGVDVFLVQTNYFTAKAVYPFSLSEIDLIVKKVKQMQKSIYILMNTMIHETDLVELHNYLSILNKMNVDGIVCFDMTILVASKEHNMEHLMIYQPGTMNTNGYDSWFLHQFKIKGMTISKEITLEDIIDISSNHHHLEISLVGHGYLDMFYSRRPLLTNYFSFKGEKIQNYLSSTSFYLKEEMRKNEEYPIVEDRFGTYIFRSKKLSSFQELGVLKPYLTDLFLERIFMSDDEYYQAIKAYQNESLVSSFFNTYNKLYDSGFYYRKTEKIKGENE